jgi:ADP-Ribosyltransferase in polyvalent proteins
VRNLRPEGMEAGNAVKSLESTVNAAGGVFKGVNSVGLVEITLPRSMTDQIPGLNDRMKDFVSVTLPRDEVTPENVKAAMDRKLAEFGGKKAEEPTPIQPIRAYHGTRSPVEFEEFNTEGPQSRSEEEQGYSGTETDPTAYLGSHFAKEPQIANKFAMQSERWLKGRVEPEGIEKPRVIPVDLHLRNPKDFGAESNLNEFIYEGDLNRAGYAGEEILNHAMRADGIKNPEDGGSDVDKWMEKYDSDPEFRAEQNEWAFQWPHRSNFENENDLLSEAAAELARQAKERLHKMGHDGVIYQNEVEGGTSYIAFHPEQIKSIFTAPTPEMKDVPPNVRLEKIQ